VHGDRKKLFRTNSPANAQRIGGIETGKDAASLFCRVRYRQVCTGVMKFGYRSSAEMKDQLLAFMEKHKFEKLSDFQRSQCAVTLRRTPTWLLANHSSSRKKG